MKACSEKQLHMTLALNAGKDSNYHEEAPAKLFGWLCTWSVSDSRSFRIVGMLFDHGWNDAPNFETMRILLTGKKH